MSHCGLCESGMSCPVHDTVNMSTGKRTKPAKRKPDAVMGDAKGSVPTWWNPKPFPSYAHIVMANDYVYCDAHCEVHGAKEDWYGEHNDRCQPEEWRPLFVATNDPDEEF